MTVTKTFGQLGIKPKNLTGLKITIEEVIDKEITVLDYRSGDSKFSRAGNCLTMQILHQGETRVIFTGSNVLLEDLQKVPSNGFPFTTTIKKIPFNEKSYFFKFT